MPTTITVDRVRTPADRRAYIELPHRLYRATSQWVPWFRQDMRRLLARRHPYYEHSTSESFLARRDGRVVARAEVLHNTRFNEHQGCRAAHFYFFDTEDDGAAVAALFRVLRRWAGQRGLDTLIGPFGFGGTTGTGILVDGYEHPAAMTMMAWNPPCYARLLEEQGLTKWLDLYSSRIDARAFALPERVRGLADKVLARGRFRVLRFRRKSELRKLAGPLGEVYNTALASDPAHREAYPMTEREIHRATADLMSVADPSLIKVLAYEGTPVGFVFGFPDVTATLKRNDGRLDPISILRLVSALKSTRNLIVNGAGILPRYQKLGGNALLYTALEESSRARAFDHVEMVQVADNTALMQRDLQTLGARVWKTHRVYRGPV